LKLNKQKYIKLLIIIAGFIILFILIYIFIIKKHGSDKDKSNNIRIEKKTDDNQIDTSIINPEKTESGIDSILTSFGILKEWVVTSNAQIKDKAKSNKENKDLTKTLWFSKRIEIPKDLSTIEVNYDLTNYFKDRDFSVSVDEDIKTKDIEMNVYKNSDTIKSQAIIFISLKHSDKIQRASGYVSMVINKFYDYKDEQIADLIQNENNYSFLMPYNLDHTDIINKLVHNKKETVIELNVNEAENFESEFRAGMSPNEITKKVKELQSDFPNVKNVILKNNLKSGSDRQLTENIGKELEKFHLKVFKDSLFITNNVTNSSELVNLIRDKSNQKKYIYIIVNFSYDELIKFRDESTILKKKGYKFYTLTELMNIEIEKIRKDKEAQEKKKEEKPKPIEKKEKKKEVKVKKK
jgi:hypothetical protein